jgi:dTDP-4-amino-4,6-dideoxygalactose transaminase
MNLNTDFIPFAKPSFSKEEEDAVLDVIRSGWLTTGSITAELESRTAGLSGVKHALAVNSATSGLHLALEASGIQPGDYVITSPYTFTATAEVIRYVGAHPLFADIEDGGYNIDPEKIIEVIKTHDKSKGRIAAIIPVHIAGELCRREEILEIAAKYNLAVIEDGAHLQPAPQLTDQNSILVYSFYATKCITTGEGGMIVTNNDNAAARMKTMRFHGINREAWDRYRKSGSQSWDYDIIAPGYKYNLPDILSAVGLVQLDKAAAMLERRMQIAEQYDKGFSECDYLRFMEAEKQSSRHLYILRIITEKLSIGRDEFVDILTRKGIGLSVHYKPLHIMSYYKNTYKLKAEDFPESLARFRNSFSLPIYPDLTDSDISEIISIIKETGSQYRRS